LPADAAPSTVLAPDLPGTGERLVLSSDESHYLARVCRARPGDRATATDGRGAVATLRLIDVGAVVTAEIESRETLDGSREAWLLCGAPEGERADWMVEKLAELGVRVLQPIDGRRGAWRGSERRIERWRRLAMAALRQSRGAFLLEVRPPRRLDEALADLPAGGARWLCDVAGPSASASRASDAGLEVGLVGPAGGFDVGERERAQGAGFRPMRLAQGRLRTETAALAWSSWWASATPTPGSPDEGGRSGS
jgi:16S rRNA (uracil1498-N3)-methyltransferase